VKKSLQQLFPRCKETLGASGATSKKGVTKKKVKKKKKTTTSAASAANKSDVKVANIIDLSGAIGDPALPAPPAVYRPSPAQQQLQNIIDLNDPGQCSGFVPPPLQPTSLASKQQQQSVVPGVMAATSKAGAAAMSSSSASPSPSSPSSTSVSPPTDEASGMAVQRRKQQQQHIRETKIEIAGRKKERVAFIYI
jgi:hypothetical protein